ncbi:MAG: phosphoenolpyruvate--protein phosphotransferase [Deltaproteobacteria bacterium]|nr:phosphoenolpyruvate--protein phosphotransferase [Deltaproteobacteria bacterium]
MNDKEGMHMRPANELAKATKGYASSIALRMHRTGEDGAEELVEADAKSARSVMQSEIRFGETVSIEAVGPDAKEAAETVRALFESGFPLEEKPAATKEPPAAALTASLPGVSPPKVTGAPVSPGIGIGKAYVLSEASLDFSHVVAKDPDTERGRLKGAVDAFVSESREREKEVSERLGKDEAAIFDGHVGLLTDPETQKELDQAIASGKSAEGAVDQVTKKAAAEMAALQSEKFRARAADWEAIRSRLLGNLLGVRTDVSDLGDGGVLVLRELTPFMATGLDRDRVQGIVAETGGKTSHSAILARSMGIPSVMGAAGALLAIKDGDELIVDGDRGEVWASPDDATRAAYEKARVDWLESKKALEAYKDKPTVDADGKRYFVLANVSGPAEAVVAAEAGAEGVGLFRTELIFMGRDTLPTEDEQLDAYSKVADALGDKELIIRTMDIGGDKPVPYLNLPHEDNPFLGFRAIRFCLANKDVFSVQLRAILRASSGRPKIRIMLPMITSVREIQAAKELIATLKDELKAKGVPFNDGIKVGIMVETPAAVQDAELLAGEADFFSIGTNDLTQYTLAADRGNPKLEKLYSHYHPAVLKSVKQVIAAAHSKGKSVGMCGESAGAKGLIPLYISFGLDEWSVSPSSVLSVRREILGWTKKEADELAAHALTLPSTEDVEAYLNEATANRA